MTRRQVPPSVTDLEQEFEGASLSDPRRERRLLSIVKSLSADPSASIPEAAHTDAALEGTYRFLSSPHVSAPDILAPHLRMTTQRCSTFANVLVVHDTTEISFLDERRARAGLGRISNKQGKMRGFFAHVAFALSDETSKRPLGIVGLQSFVRTEESKKPKHPRARFADTQRESMRWGALVNEVEERLEGASDAIHVMDREADQYTLLAQMTEKQQRFVIRFSRDRRVVMETVDEKRLMSDVIAEAAPLAEREVALATRQRSSLPKERKLHPPRAARTTKLCISATDVVIRRPDHFDAELAPTLSVRVVDVTEVDPPSGEAPVHWTLLTSERVETAADAERIVDIYRARWTIEELFKALKTGCRFEQRQIESYAGLLKLLAIFLPIAWRLLLLRTLGRSGGEAPASTVLTATQLDVLKATTRIPLSDAPTVEQAMYAIARFGGHLKRNGAPGWKTLSDGFETLLNYEIAWLAAQKKI